MIATVSSPTMCSCFFYEDAPKEKIELDPFPMKRQPSIAEIDREIDNAKKVSWENHRYMELKNITQYERDLVARCIYHEARGEIEEGQIAVCEVIFNRVLSELYPNTVEDVLFQYNGKFYQFSCAPYLLSEPIREPESLARAMKVQAYVLSTEYTTLLPSDYLYFSTGKPDCEDYMQIGNHYFW